MPGNTSNMSLKAPCSGHNQSEEVEGAGGKVGGGGCGPLRKLLAVSRCWKVRWKLFHILNDASIS